jgi:16S rRNA (adenine1518-N6/adenine1519-N6)-dimethyltransferase
MSPEDNLTGDDLTGDGLTGLPALRETLAAQGLLAKKSFGQHFLLDLNVTRKIARLAGPLEGQTVIEVGPGPGGLTRALLEAGAARVIAIEKDPRFADLLQQLAAVANGRLKIVEADALDADEAALVAADPLAGAMLPAGSGAGVHIVANLPYNVGTPLLIKWLTGPFTPASMTLMFQKEVARRIVAGVGEDDYGRLAVISQACAVCRIAMTLPARAFTPPPKVESAVVRLDPRSDAPTPTRRSRLEIVTRAAFGQRRKMLRASLKPIGGEALCRRAEIDPSKRAEEIDVEGFLRLADALSGLG